ncbi:hypothetical protein FrEUN1fDRAFT_5101 [Parafrankia sp. EUN1f]|nr:hypothetical protein FrEUN1fDRAFT_5101 [Parafrankia sp. EUN1f]
MRVRGSEVRTVAAEAKHVHAEMNTGGFSLIDPAMAR